MTLRKLAQAICPSDDESEESEDESSPNEDFVAKVHEMHNDGHLLQLVEQGGDLQRNPLVSVSNGSVHPVEISKFEQEFPLFYQQLVRMRKRLGSFGFLNQFLRQHYEQSLHPDTYGVLSQIEYVQLAVQNLMLDN